MTYLSAISTYLARIKTAIYGEEVRGSIHDAIEQCYSDVSAAKTIADNSNSTSLQTLQQAQNAVNQANSAVTQANNVVGQVTAARDAAIQAKNDAVSAKDNASALADQVTADKSAVTGIKTELTALAQSVNAAAQDTTANANAAAESAQEADEIRSSIEELYRVHEAEIADRAKLAILDCFKHVAWVDEDGLEYYNALVEALEPPVVDYITATYNAEGNLIYPSDSLDSLRKYLLVHAFYTNGKEAYTKAYTLSGRLAVGNCTITAEYFGKTASFTVAVTALTLSSITCVYQQSGTVFTTDSLDVLKADLVVTAHYANSTEQVLDALNYELSGTLSEGTSTITVTYGGKTATFDVTVSAEPASDVLYELASPVHFDGVDSSKVINTGLQLGKTNDAFSIFVEFTDANTAEWKFLIHCMHEVNPYPGFSFCNADGNKMRWLDRVTDYWFVKGNSSSDVLRFAYSLSSDGGTIIARMSVNGVEKTQTTPSWTNTHENRTGQPLIDEPLVFGGNYAGPNNYDAIWTGVLRKAIVYNRACSNSEITDFLTSNVNE